MLGLNGVELVRESALRRNFFFPPQKGHHPSSEFRNLQNFLILSTTANRGFYN